MIDIVCCPTPSWLVPALQLLPKLKELPVEEVGHLGRARCGGWDRGTEAPGREGRAGRGWGRLLGSSCLCLQLFSLLLELLPGWSSSCYLTLGIQDIREYCRDSYPESLPLVTLFLRYLMVNLGSDRFIRQVRAGRCMACPEGGCLFDCSTL